MKLSEDSMGCVAKGTSILIKIDDPITNYSHDLVISRSGLLDAIRDENISKTVDHLGIVATVCKEIGLVKEIDKREVITGSAVMAMVLNGLGFVNRPKIKMTVEKAGIKKREINEIVMAGDTKNILAVKKAVEEEAGAKIGDVDGWNPMVYVAEGTERIYEKGKNITNILKKHLQKESGDIKMNVTHSIWELNTGRIAVPIFERGCPLPAEKLQLMIANIDNQTSMEFEILKDGQSFCWIILNLPASIRTGERLEIIFKINNAESFDFLAKVPRIGKNIQITKKPKISDYYRELSSRWGYDDIYAILSIAHNASDIESAFANKRFIHRNSEEINDIITKAYSEVDTPDKRKKLYLQKVIINNLSKKHNFYENESCKEKILINCKDRIKEDFFSLIMMQENVIHRTILEIEKPNPIRIPGINKKDHLGITKDEAEEGTNISLGVMSAEDKKELKIIIPRGSSDGLVPIPNEGVKHKCIPYLKGDATIKVKVIPIDAKEIFEDIKKESKIDFKNSYKKDIIKAIREEVRKQYHTSDDIDINEEKIINNIISVLPPPIRFDITLKEAIFGCQKRGTLFNQKCEMCGGKGYIESSVTKWTTKKCSCNREINIKVPPIKTILLDYIIPIENGQILVKSQLGLLRV